MNDTYVFPNGERLPLAATKFDISTAVRHSWDMDKQEHGARLKAAIARRRLSREDVAEAASVKPRTVTNWTSGVTMPSDVERVLLRELLGDYDNPGDPVEVAVRGSRLTEDRQYTVLGVYKRELREQDEADERRRTG